MPVSPETLKKALQYLRGENVTISEDEMWAATGEALRQNNDLLEKVICERDQAREVARRYFILNCVGVAGTDRCTEAMLEQWHDEEERHPWLKEGSDGGE